LARDLWQRIGGWAHGAEVINTYGISETASWLAGSLGICEPRDGLIGHGWGSELRIGRQADTCPTFAGACPNGETGYVWTQTAKLMKGYFHRDDLTDAVISGGWFFTGDMGFIDESGRLVLAGRAIDEINKGGLKIQPQDVENAAEGYRFISDVCAFAVADEFYGQNVALAFVMTDTNQQSLGEFHQWMEGRLSRHKMPAVWYRLEALPRTARGKIQRKAVAELCDGKRPLDGAAMKS
jgi:acyl-CoA synthetase (AMP-forming)/AMP-acid ligase II